MIRLLSSASDSMMFWRIMFFAMALCALGFYANPRIVIKQEYIYFMLGDDDESYEPYVTESEAI